jgi:hypothetical protein
VSGASTGATSAGGVSSGVGDARARNAQVPGGDGPVQVEDQYLPSEREGARFEVKGVEFATESSRGRPAGSTESSLAGAYRDVSDTRPARAIQHPTSERFGVDRSAERRLLEDLTG